MNIKNLLVATRQHSTMIKAAVTIMIALSFALACTSTTAYAKKKRKVNYGQVEISTNPGGFPLRIDGKSEGTTSTTVRLIAVAGFGTLKSKRLESSASILTIIRKSTPSRRTLARIRLMYRRR